MAPPPPRPRSPAGDVLITACPVLEIQPCDGFALWPTAPLGAYGLLPLSGAVAPAEIGTAVMSVAEYNDDGDGGLSEPLGAFLHGLVDGDPPLVPGGLRITDTATGVTLLPGCCDGLEDRGDWWEVVDGGGPVFFGHDPSPIAERVGDTVRLTVDAEADGGPVIETTATDLRRLLADAERDLADFLRATAAWTAPHLPGHADRVDAALARALGPSRSAVPPGP
ncbi:hypothetical protein [Nocardiopsis halotolerans]|uniref:hypothetical protein n=1 Tax=Nocardiopsis halotolerans TaxID=124252 RepID=UPI0003457ADC|nr:hypothetical protein [Nocardiopsis halotolerans]